MIKISTIASCDALVHEATPTDSTIKIVRSIGGVSLCSFVLTGMVEGEQLYTHEKTTQRTADAHKTWTKGLVHSKIPNDHPHDIMKSRE